VTTGITVADDAAHDDDDDDAEDKTNNKDRPTVNDILVTLEDFMKTS